MKLEGKSIVVTGASAGMGQAIVTLFAQEGANVIAVARRKERLDALAEALKEEPRVRLFHMSAMYRTPPPATE